MESTAQARIKKKRFAKLAPEGTVLRSLVTGVSASIFAITFLLLRNPEHPIRTALLEYAFFISAPIAIVSLYLSFSSREDSRSGVKIPGLIYLVSALTFGAVYILGMHQFGGFDEGLIVHAATFYFHGFRPYLDFNCTMPPLFMAGIRLGTQLFGFQWRSILFTSGLFAAVTAIWMFYLLQMCSISRRWSLWITIAAELSTMVVIPFWWYNNTSSVAVILLLLSALACLQRAQHAFPWISLTVSLGMVLASKPNVLPACLMVAVLASTKDKKSLQRLLISVVGAICLASLICFSAQMPFADIVRSYIEVGRIRGTPFKILANASGPEKAFQVLFILECVYCFAVLLRLAWKRQQESWRPIALCALASITSLAFASTNSEFKVSDLSCLFTAATLLCLSPWESRSYGRIREAVLVGWIAVFVCMAGFYSVTHRRIMAIGPEMFYEPLQTKTIQNGYFTGLEAAPRFQRVVWQTQQVVRIFPNSKFFFGPRMEFNYAVFEKPPLKGMPLLWDTGDTYAEDRVPELIAAFRADDPEILIFLKDDFTRMDKMATYIIESGKYDVSEDFADITVFIRKKSPSKTIGEADSQKQPIR